MRLFRYININQFSVLLPPNSTINCFIMKKLLLTLFLFAGTLAVSAYDYPYLTFQTSSGTETSVSVESLKMTISDGALVVTNADGETQFTLSDLSKMYFSESPTSVAVTAADDVQAEEVEVLSMAGISLGKYANATEARKAMKSGVYVLKSKSQTIKIAVK